MATFKVAIASNGRLVLPIELRRRLGVEAGGQLFFEDRGGTVVLETLDDRIARAQATVRQYIVPTGTEVDDFIAERRAEAARE